jgi:two-component system nitrate/nitrite response regulator NarL
MVKGGSAVLGPNSAPTVVAIDDRPVVARGLHSTFDDASGVCLVGVFDSVAALDGTVADVATLELALRDGSRPRDNVTALRNRGLKVLVYTSVYDVRLLAEALDAGAQGIVLKHHPEETLLEAIRRVHSGETYLPDEVVQQIGEGVSSRPRLSAREVQVLNLLYEGLITKQAARRLQVSESTVKEHLKRVRQKYSALGRTVSTRVQLLQVAERDGFIDRAGQDPG